MSSNGHADARQLRASLHHPVIDADGHWIEKLEFAVRQLGYKVAMLGGLMRRPVPALAQEHPEASRFVEWYDVSGIDSDYDPVKAATEVLAAAPART